MHRFSHKISEESFQYRGEGNACLVVRLQVVDKDFQVLRLVKEDVAREVSVDSEVVRQQLEDHVEVIKNVMQPLLGEDVIYLPYVMQLSKEDIKVINRSVKNCRPGMRLHKTVKEKDTYALVLLDYCSLPKHLLNYSTIGPLISIEIKPKQGFLRSDAFYSCHKFKPPLCHYCIMQYHKVKKSDVSKRSKYCPLDLFSGCPSRMLFAIKALLHAPQNNFRIFKDSDLLYSAETEKPLDDALRQLFPLFSTELNLISMLGELIMNALLDSTNQDMSSKLKISSFKQKQCINSNPDSLCEESACTHELPVGCVLYRILQVQMLDAMDYRELYPFYKETEKANPSNNNRQKIGCLDLHKIPAHLGEEDQCDSESDIEYASRKVWEYLLAMTLKDCSLMITFKLLDNRFDQNQENVNIVKDRNGNSFLFSLGIIDLDMKTFDKAEAQYKRKASIVQTYLNIQKGI